MNKLILIFAVVFLSLILTGCEEQQGPAERAGESIDQTMEDTGDVMENAADDAEDGIGGIGDELEDATD